jgi:hypothetical protein
MMTFFRLSAREHVAMLEDCDADPATALASGNRVDPSIHSGRRVRGRSTATQ